MAGTGGVNNPNGSHLMICLLTDQKNENVLIVPVVTKRTNYDCTCPLEQSDHEFITHSSCADYSNIKKCSVKALEKQFDEKVCVKQEKITNEKILDLWQGLMKSEETAQWAVDFAKKLALPQMIKLMKQKLEAE